MDEIARIQQACARLVPKAGSNDFVQVEARKRKVSLLVGAELRRRGLLAEEGYAPGSWADPKNARPTP